MLGDFGRVALDSDKSFEYFNPSDSESEHVGSLLQMWHNAFNVDQVLTKSDQFIKFEQLWTTFEHLTILDQL